MKINQQAEAALKQPDTKVLAIEMTDERWERFCRVFDQIIDLLRANTEGPAEAYMLLNVIRNGFEEYYGIRGGMAMGKESTDG